MSISNTGVILDPSSTAIAEAQQILIDTYGASVNLSPTSPNGLLVQNIALAITKREADQADTVNAMNPNIATGTQLDAVCANLDIQRIPATKSTATVQVTGLTGVTIPATTQVQSTNNDIFLVEALITIGAGGTATGTVIAQDPGPIPVGANTINKIITGISGWDTINNSGAGTLGVAQQSDAEFRETRVDRLGFASAGSLASVSAGSQELNPVSIYLAENLTDSNVINAGITILPHSILLVLEGGGSDAQVGDMLFKRLSGGCAMSGSESYNVPIPNSLEIFVAKWQIATQRALKLRVTLKLGAVYPPDIEEVIAGIVNLGNPKFDFNVIGRLIEASQFIYILIANGIFPILALTFDVGATTNQTTYQMPISDSLGTSLLAENVLITYA